MSKTLTKLQCRERVLQSQLAQTVATKDGIMRELEDVQAGIKRLESDREILDVDAPRCGDRWALFEKINFEDAIKDFIFGRAKIYGRSTLAIRCKVVEAVAKDVPDATRLRILNAATRR